jgi:hypothetical protein
VKIILIWLALLLGGCTQVDDGPMSSLPPNAVRTTGQGYYLAGSLDSGAFYHPKHDSLLVKLDSLWILSECALQQLKDSVWVTGATIHMYFKALLDSDTEVNCAELGIGYDSIFAINRFWGDGIESIVLHADTRVPGKNYPYEDSTTIVDTVFIKNGTVQDSSMVIGYDSLFFADDAAVHFADTGNLYLIRRVKDFVALQQTQALVTQYCLDETDDCSTVTDTVVAQKSSLQGDTLLHYVRKKCQIDTLNYCVFGTWSADSLQDTLYLPLQDTLWYYQTVLAEKMDKCSVYNMKRQITQGYKSRADSIRVWRQLFVLEANECEQWPNNPTLHTTSSNAQVTFWDLEGDSLLSANRGDTLIQLLDSIWGEI